MSFIAFADKVIDLHSSTVTLLEKDFNIDSVSYSSVSLGGTRPHRFNQQVLQAWQSNERVNQSLITVGRSSLKYLSMKRQFPRTILSANFEMLDSLDKGDVWAFWFWKYIICKNFFCKTKHWILNFKFCAQTSEE